MNPMVARQPYMALLTHSDPIGQQLFLAPRGQYKKCPVPRQTQKKAEEPISIFRLLAEPLRSGYSLQNENRARSARQNVNFRPNCIDLAASLVDEICPVDPWP